MITKLHPNVHRIVMDFKKKKTYKFLLMSDIHWDNPDCDRKLLEKHLQYARDNDAKVLVNGDFFCLMQGKGDPRRSKDKVLPEHNNGKYLDSIVQTAVEYWDKWKDVLIWVGYGNHETGIIKHQETDILQRFVDMHNHINKPEIPLELGGYTSWVILNAEYDTVRKPFVIHAFHGSGGGGAVTKGTIQHQRKMADVENADAIWMGHVHELYTMTQSKTALDNFLKPYNRDVWHFRTGTYKDEYKDGHHGWHVERGAPAKPLGCVELDITFRRQMIDGVRKVFLDVKPSILI